MPFGRWLWHGSETLPTGTDAGISLGAGQRLAQLCPLTSVSPRSSLGGRWGDAYSARSRVLSGGLVAGGL